jgi:hypothetical protein
MNNKEIIEVGKTPKMVLRKTVGNTLFSDLQSMFFTFNEYEPVFDKFMNMVMHVIPKEEALSKHVVIELLKINELNESDFEKEKKIIKLLMMSLIEVFKYDIFTERKDGKNTIFNIWDPFEMTLYDFTKKNKQGSNCEIFLERKSEDKKHYYNENAKLIMLLIFSQILDQEFVYKKTCVLNKVYEDIDKISIEI